MQLAPSFQSLGICCFVEEDQGLDDGSATPSQRHYSRCHPEIVGVPAAMTGCMDLADAEQAIAATDHNQDACDGGEENDRGCFRVQHCFLKRPLLQTRPR